jgi:hypothetical protein
MVVPENLSREGGIRDRHRRLYGAENIEREKLSDCWMNDQPVGNPKRKV